MFIERMLNDGNAPIIEASVRFAAARHRLLTENIANADTPGYLQKDLSVSKFQSALADRIESRDQNGSDSVGFNDIASDIENPASGILFHDRNNRSMEQLMSDSAQNALMHNMMIELLRRQFSQIELALKEHVA